MLKTPEGLEENAIADGVLAIGYFNLECDVWGWGSCTPHWKMYPGLDEADGEWFNSYGVCDTPAQFISKFGDRLNRDPRTFVVGLTHISKDPSNKGVGGGWRWHKWGPYVGDGIHECEYLDDEEGFDDGVYVYHILQTDGPCLIWNWKERRLEERDGSKER